MCESCLAGCVYLGEVLPGLHLERAIQAGHYLKQGDYSLTRCNSPQIYWQITPRSLPYPEVAWDELVELEEKVDEAITNWILDARKFAEEIDAGTPDGNLCNESIELTIICLNAGWVPHQRPTLFEWLFDRIGKFLESSACQPLVKQ